MSVLVGIGMVTFVPEYVSVLTGLQGLELPLLTAVAVTLLPLTAQVTVAVS